MRIIKNPDEEFYKEISKKVKENDNYCPCSLEKNEDTKCMCKEFREQIEEGYCHCMRYKKEKEEE